MSKYFVKKVDISKGKKFIQLSRDKLGTLIRVITGHNACNYFRSKIDPEISHVCRLCGNGREEFWHFYRSCSAIETDRHGILFGKDLTEWDVIDVLKIANIEKVKSILDSNFDDDNAVFNRNELLGLYEHDESSDWSEIEPD